MIHPKEDDNVGVADIILTAEILSNGTSAKDCAPLNGVETDIDMEEQPIDFIDEQNRHPFLHKSQLRSTVKKMTMPRRIPNPPFSYRINSTIWEIV